MVRDSILYQPLGNVFGSQPGFFSISMRRLEKEVTRGNSNTKKMLGLRQAYYFENHASIDIGATHENGREYLSNRIHRALVVNGVVEIQVLQARN